MGHTVRNFHQNERARVRIAHDEKPVNSPCKDYTSRLMVISTRQTKTLRQVISIHHINVTRGLVGTLGYVLFYKVNKLNHQPTNQRVNNASWRKIEVVKAKNSLQNNVDHGARGWLNNRPPHQLKPRLPRLISTGAVISYTRL